MKAPLSFQVHWCVLLADSAQHWTCHAPLLLKAPLWNHQEWKCNIAEVKAILQNPIQVK